MKELLYRVHWLRALAVTTVLFVLALLPKHANAQCAVTYGDISMYDEATVLAYYGVIDYYYNCFNPGTYDFTHYYYADLTTWSPSGRIASGSGYSSAYGGGGGVEAWALLGIEDEAGLFSFSASVGIVCSAMGPIGGGGGGGGIVVPRTWEVRINAFIPWAWVSDGLVCQILPVPRTTIVRGDNRTSYDRDGSYRIRQRAFLIPATGGSNNATSYVGESRRYDYTTSVGTDTTQWVVPAEDTVLDDCFQTHDIQNASLSNAHVTLTGDAGAKWSKVQFHGYAREPFNELAPAIDWDVSVTINDNGSSPPTYFVTWLHDCFPAFEVWIGGQQIYPYWPSDGSFLTIGNCLSGGNQRSGSASGTLN